MEVKNEFSKEIWYQTFLKTEQRKIITPYWALLYRWKLSLFLSLVFYPLAVWIMDTFNLNFSPIFVDLILLIVFYYYAETKWFRDPFYFKERNLLARFLSALYRSFAKKGRGYEIPNIFGDENR